MPRCDVCMDPAAEKRKERNACTAMCCPNASTAAVHVPSLSPGPLPCLRGVYVTVTCGRYTRRYCRRIPGVGGRIPGVETERERDPSSRHLLRVGTRPAKSQRAVSYALNFQEEAAPSPLNLFCLPVTLVPGSPVVPVPFC